MGTNKRTALTYLTWNCAACVLLVVCHVHYRPCEGAITGSASCGSKGEYSRVSCHFSEDITKLDSVTGIVLTRQLLSDSKSTPDIAVECHRVNGSPFMCIWKPGYKVHNISNVLSVDILTEDAAHEGRYSCVLIPERLVTYSEAQHCVLKFTGGITGRTVCENGPLAEQTRVSCHFSKDISKQHKVTGIVLQRQLLTDPNSVPEVAVECHRVNGFPWMCIWKPGFKVHNISNVMAVDILTEDMAHEGQYSCVLLPEKLVTYNEEQHCVLKFTGVITGRTVCETSPVKKNTVSCLFSEDIGKMVSVAGIVMRRQSLYDPNSMPDVVVECYRVNGNPLRCLQKPGYKVHNISNVMAVDIFTDSIEHEGQYSCVLLPELAVTYYEDQRCVLKFTADKPPSDTAGESATRGNNASDTGAEQTNIILPVLCGVLFTVCGILLALLIYLKRNRCLRHLNQTTNSTANGDGTLNEALPLEKVQGSAGHAAVEDETVNETILLLPGQESADHTATEDRTPVQGFADHSIEDMPKSASEELSSSGSTGSGIGTDRENVKR